MGTKTKKLLCVLFNEKGDKTDIAGARLLVDTETKTAHYMDATADELAKAGKVPVKVVKELDWKEYAHKVGWLISVPPMTKEAIEAKL